MGNPRVALVSNGVNRIQMSDSVVCYEAGLDAPPAAPTFNAKIDGSLGESANYYAAFCYRRTLHGIIGNASTTSAVMTTGTAAASEDGLRINIPADSALQTGIDQAEAYRSVSGGTALFYDSRKAYSGSAITMDLTIADSALGSTLPTTNNTPTTRPYLLSFGDQMHSAGSKTYGTGTIGVTNAGTTVTGTGTAWTKGMVGMRFNRTGDGSKFYTITAVSVSGQTLTIAAYAGTTVASGASYTISVDPLRTDWSHINSSGTILPESWPTDNYDILYGGQDNEKITGLGKVNDQKLIFTNLSTWSTRKSTANTYTRRILLPGVGLMNYRTIANDPELGDVFWQDQNAQIRRSGGSSTTTYNLSKHFIANILDGTHTGIHRNLRVNTAKYSYGHAIFYGFKNWYMLFQPLGTDTYSTGIFVCDIDTNPTGAKEVPSPWMLWTGLTAVCSGMLQDANKNLRPYFADDLGYIWLLDSGTNDGVPSGTTTGTITTISSTVLTDSAATFYTTNDGLKGVRVRTYDATTGELENDIVVASNTATALTVAAWTTTPTVGDTYVVGGIIFERYTKVWHEGVSYRQKKTGNLYLHADKPSTSYNLNVHHYKDRSATAEVAAGQNIDLSLKFTHQIKVAARGTHHQLKFSNKFAAQPITIFDFSRQVDVRGVR